MFKYILILLIFIITLIIDFIGVEVAMEGSILIISTSVFIQLYSIYQIYSNNDEPYSLHKVFYLFSLFFFGIAPLKQYFDKTVIWTNKPLTDMEYVHTNFVILFIVVIYNILYNGYRRYLYQKNRVLQVFLEQSSKDVTRSKVNFIKCLKFFLVSSLSFYIVYRSNGYNIYAMVFRGGDILLDGRLNDVQESSQMSWLVVNNFIRPLSMMIFLYYILEARKFSIPAAIFFLLAFLTCMPTAVPRFAAAALYIPFFLILFPASRNKYVFSSVFLLGILVVFPFLDLFRTFTSFSSNSSLIDFGMFNQGHFDSYQNFAIILNNGIVTYGNQIMGVVFFWIPRAYWLTKPVGSGTYVARKLNFDFENISANYFAEGFINFGYLGVIMFLLFLVWATAKYDSYFWSIKFSRDTKGYLQYLMTLGFTFFLLRGDLLNATAYYIGFMFSLNLVNVIYKRRFIF